MNKMLTGAIAISASALLLVGGGGTLAVWNDTAGVKPGTITAGNIALEAEGGKWSNVTSGTAVPIANIAEYEIVPGETLRYTQSLNIIVEGTNAVADLKVSGGFVNGFESEGVTLSGYLAVNGTRSKSFEDNTIAASDTFEGTIRLGNSYAVDGVLEFAFSENATASAYQEFTFQDVLFTLNQVLPSQAGV